MHAPYWYQRERWQIFDFVRGNQELSLNRHQQELLAVSRAQRGPKHHHFAHLVLVPVVIPAMVVMVAHMTGVVLPAHFVTTGAGEVEAPEEVPAVPCAAVRVVRS
jgi:hypothetical protein